MFRRPTLLGLESVVGIVYLYLKVKLNKLALGKFCSFISNMKNSKIEVFIIRLINILHFYLQNVLKFNMCADLTNLLL